MIAFDPNYARRRSQRLSPPILHPVPTSIHPPFDSGPPPDANRPIAYDDSCKIQQPLTPASSCVNMVYDPASQAVKVIRKGVHNVSFSREQHR